MSEILNADEAAEILRCKVDTLRRISKDELPVYNGPGRCNLYLMEDIKYFLRSRRILPKASKVSKQLLREVVG